MRKSIVSLVVLFFVIALNSNAQKYTDDQKVKSKQVLKEYNDVLSLNEKQLTSIEAILLEAENVKEKQKELDASDSKWLEYNIQRVELNKKLLNTLTEEQKSKWQEYSDKKVIDKRTGKYLGQKNDSIQ